MDDYTISWVAPEYGHREHGADWYWALAIVSISLSVAFVIVGNILLSIIIILGIGTLLVYSKHPPKNIECRISKKGIRSGKTLYPWEALESFWILYEKEDTKFPHDPKILLTSKKTFATHIVIPLDKLVANEVHQYLSHALHEVPQSEPITERIMRVVGF